MSKTKSLRATEELISMYWETTENQDLEVNREVLRKYDITKFQWDHFIEWTQDLDLNLDGIKILLEEMLAGQIDFTRD